MPSSAVTRFIQRESKLKDLTPLPPYKTISTPAKQKKVSHDLNKSNCYKGMQNEKDSVHLFTKEISEDQTPQQNKALKSLEDEALHHTLDTELIKTIPIDDGEINKLHFKNPSAYCDENGVHFMIDKKANYVLNESKCYKGFQDERKSMHMSTKEISENQAQQQTKTLKTAEDEAVDFELIHL